MKIEMDESTGWTVCGCVVVIIFVCGAMGGCYVTEQTKQTAIKAGLVEKQNLGTGYTHWTKPE